MRYLFFEKNILQIFLKNLRYLFFKKIYLKFSLGNLKYLFMDFSNKIYFSGSENPPYLCLFCTGVTRCFCNEARCVSTSYMCKSTHGTCYTLYSLDGVSGGGDTYHSIHGCSDSLSVEQRRGTCDDNYNGVNEATLIKAAVSAVSRDRFHLRCCRQDMCNYTDSFGGNVATTNRLSIDRHATTGTIYRREQLVGHFSCV